MSLEGLVSGLHGYIQEGEIIGGRYRVTGVLGQGGFGTVYDAVHETTGHAVAVKVLSERDDAASDEMQRRFFQEAATTSRLSHPNTVRVYDFGETDGGFLFLAMERLVGETLQEVRQRNVNNDTVMDDVEAANIGIAVLRSLGEAHAHGLVHRDLKPANIFLHEIAGGDRIVKVLDFGIVKDIDTAMTQAGKTLGTPTHMSPEQAMGMPVDARSDLYALGVCLYECVTGTLPFMAENPLAIVMQHVTEPVTPIEERKPGKVRPAIADVIERSLCKLPDERYDNAQDMRDSLQRAIHMQQSGVYAVLSSSRSNGLSVQPNRVTMPPTNTPRAVRSRRQTGGAGPAVRNQRHDDAQHAHTELRGAIAPPQKSSIRINIPGVEPVVVNPGERRGERLREDEKTATGSPAMLDDAVVEMQNRVIARATPLSEHDVDAATAVLDTSKLQLLSKSAILDMEPGVGHVAGDSAIDANTDEEASQTRLDMDMSARSEPGDFVDLAEHPPPIAPTSDRDLRVAPELPEDDAAEPPPPVAPQGPPPPAMDSVLLVVLGDDESQSISASASRPQPPAQPPMPRVSRTTDDRLGGFAQRGGSLRGAADLMGAAGPMRGLGGSSPFGAGSNFGDKISADLKRMTAEMQRRASGVRTLKTSVSAMALGEDLASVIYGTSAGDLRLVQFGASSEDSFSVQDGAEQIDIGEHSSMVAAIASTPDGRTVISAGSNGHVRSWSLAGGHEIGDLKLDEPVSSLAVSTDGRLAIAGCEDGTAYLLSMPNLEVTRKLAAHRGTIHAVDAASSRRIVVTAGEDGAVRTWDPVGGGSRLTKRHHDGAVASVVISRDRKWIVSGGWDGKAVVSSARNGERETTLDAHVDIVSGVAIDADSELVVTVSDDRTAKVWRLSDGSLINELTDFASAPKFVRFARDSRHAWIGTWNGTIRRIATDS